MRSQRRMGSVMQRGYRRFIIWVCAPGAANLNVGAVLSGGKHPDGGRTA